MILICYPGRDTKIPLHTLKTTIIFYLLGGFGMQINLPHDFTSTVIEVARIIWWNYCQRQKYHGKTSNLSHHHYHKNPIFPAQASKQRNLFKPDFSQKQNIESLQFIAAIIAVLHTLQGKKFEEKLDS